MARFYGTIGYVESVEKSPGVFVDIKTERNYYGDVLQNSKRWDNSENLNDDLNISNRFSIVADAYAFDHFYAIKYIRWMGADWKVHYVEVNRPRLILTVGGLYNENTTDAPEEA